MNGTKFFAHPNPSGLLAVSKISRKTVSSSIVHCFLSESTFQEERRLESSRPQLTVNNGVYLRNRDHSLPKTCPE